MRAAMLHVEEERGAPSPLKRKYDGEGGPNVQLRLRSIKHVHSNGIANARDGFLFPSGDMLLRKGSGLLLVRDVLHLTDPDEACVISEVDHGIQSIPSMCALNHLEGNWRELVGASRDGHVFSAVLDDDGHVTTLLHEDLIGAEKSPNELVTAIFHAGDVYVLGTDRGEVFVVSREGLASSVVKLQRPQGLFNMVKSGAAFLLGYAEPSAEPAQGRRGVVSLFSLPSLDRDVLLSVGVERITLWADWSQPRGHKILWERDLRDLVSEDITQVLQRGGPVADSCGAGGAVSGCQAVDALLLPADRRRPASGNTIAVLSACAVSATQARRTGAAPQVGEGDQCSLWVHVIEVHAGGSGDSGYHFVRGRYMVHAGLTPACCGWTDGASEGASRPPLQPKLHVPRGGGGEDAAPGFYVSWESPEGRLSLGSCAAPADGADTCTCHTPRCVYHTDLSSSRVLSVNVVDSLLLKDGVTIVLNDGSILHASTCVLPFGAVEADAPKSPRDPSTGAVAEWVERLLECSQEVIVAAEVAEQHQSSRMVLEDGVSMLPQFSVLPLSQRCSDQLDQLRRFFSTASEHEAAECAGLASAAICQRLPVGHSWGEDAAQLGAGGDAAAEYSLVRTSLREKCVSHMKLMWVLLSAHAWDSFSAVRERVSRHHSYLKGCLGMCLSLAESQSKRQQQAGLCSGLAWFLSTGHARMLEVVLQGMAEAVALMPERDEFAALGLRTADSFFSQALQLPRGLLCVAEALAAKEEDLHRGGGLVPCAYATLSVCLSVLQAGGGKVAAPRRQADIRAAPRAVPEEYMTSDVPCTVPFSDEVRGAVQLVLLSLRRGLLLLPAEGPLVARAPYLQKMGWRREVEGQRVAQLCAALLQAFAGELAFLAESRLSADQAARVAKLDSAYNTAKDACVDVLFLLGLTTDAFELASRFVHFRGLLEAPEQDDSLCAALYATVREQCAVVDPTDGCTPLGLFALHFYEKKNKVSTILEFSKIVDAAQLHAFFGGHPQLSWIHSVMRNSGIVGSDMGGAARAALLHSQQRADVPTAAALLSISKLSSVVAMAAALPGGEDGDDGLEAAYRSAASNLAVLRAQEVAVEEGAIGADGNARLDAEQVCDSILSCIQQLIAQGESGGEEEEETSLRRERAISMCAAALAVIGELLGEDAAHERRLVSLWALAMECDRAAWYALLSPAVATDQLDDREAAASLKSTVVAILAETALGDVQLGKVTPAILPNFGDGYILNKSIDAFFSSIRENDSTKKNQLKHLISMAAR